MTDVLPLFIQADRSVFVKKSDVTDAANDRTRKINMNTMSGMVWLNISFQVLFPLAVSFTPVMAASLAPQLPAEAREIKTVEYRLQYGETAYTVASHYGVTFSALEAMNTGHRFDGGFRTVREGDVIRVPDHVLSDTEAFHQRLAGAASQAGSFFSNHPDGRTVRDEARGMATGMVTGQANEAAQKWLSQFGQARVQFSIDEDFSLKNSQLDLLHPWYDAPHTLIFSQGSVHRTDDRNQANFGTGIRYFSHGAAGKTPAAPGGYMLGLNTFLDYDLSRDHARLGAGLEYWRDDLKLSANGYQRLTSWKDSPDLKDYEERPANGWDIRAVGYLPAYPQLGAKVMYEQYYGREVALFGKDNRQKNPHAVTLGLNYTPFPLLTLSAEQRQGKSGENDSRVSAELSYRFGDSFRQLLDTDAVAERRSLAGSRYDFVERNNNIVLEYRKKEVIRLRLPARIEGQSGETLPVALSVQAKHGLQDITWDDGALTAAGGHITGHDTQWQLTLPAWQPGAVNAWLVSAVAHDRDGNASKTQEMQIVVTAPQISTVTSTLALNDSRLLADGKAQTEVNVVLSNAAGQPVTGMAEQIKLSGALTPNGHLVQGMLIRSRAAVATQPVLSTVTETSAGHYHATLTAGTVAGNYQLNAQVLETALTPATVILEDTQAIMENSTLTSDKPALTADGQDVATLTLTLKDAHNQPVIGEEDRLSFYVQDSAMPTQAYTFGAVQTQKDKPGQYTVTFSGTQAAQHLALGVKINGKDSGKAVFLDLTAGLSVSISGSPVVGEELKAVTVCSAGSTNCGALTYQWVIEDKAGSGHYVPISGATQTTYKPVAGDQKRHIEVTVN
ncbi:hypothetical protein D6O72_23750 [Salmonella enterica]|nr:hypothetical protein [Salmonella enterica]